MKFFRPFSVPSKALVCGILLACLQAAGVHASSAAGIRDLAPIRLYPVEQISIDPPVPLPDPIPEGATLTESPGLEDDIWDVNVDVSWNETDFQKWQKQKLSPSSQGLRTKRGSRRARLPSLGRAAGSSDPWARGASNWRYTGERGLGVSLGSNEISVPAWANSARMGGISISQSSGAKSESDHAWQYSMSVGALDYSGGQEQGDLNYGPTASSTVLRYKLSPQFIVESQLEMAPDLLTTGVGGRYKTNGWGAWSAGIARASYGLEQGWRYQASYEVDVLDDLKLGWFNERHTAGFTDLSRYQEGAIAASGTRQQLSATVSLGRWGDLAGMYESARSSLGDSERSFGFTQQFWYSPNLRIGFRAERELVSGDYDVGIRFSVPIN
ncbi:hypothetical protein EKL30_11245 [Candidimonas sp. SYP-B2681]|uniref:hypothetical protein n=1 Tax=Candidimonas sp. SYP-B2681 TaxID=2497686 RepID=UPI000F86BA74|nr:hypothetical protein [Candidimonas sp. SYP-B2681]RTZ42294.1 hypothetical protein EKL30_11245 [Candidimonas sp. SYP-B2681]